jgi:hypothetical protein
MQYYEEIRIDSWDKAKDYFTELLDENEFWIFRGHYKSEWKLQPSLERILSNKTIDLDIESQIITEFQRRAHQYLNSTALPGNLLEWLALMQHHGSPTRMLDFTKSPYISSFVAFENTYKEKGEVAIWAIDSLWLKRSSITRIKEANISDLQIDYKHIKNDREIIKLVNTSVEAIFPLEPVTMNERLTIQQALFLFPSGKRLSFEDTLKTYMREESEKYIKKLILPKSQGLNCLIDLQRMNISAATLFPGLDGFARSLRTIPDIAYNSVYKDIDNIFNIDL